MSTDSVSNFWTDVADETTFTTIPINSATSNTVTDLGSSAVSDLQTELSVDDEWGIGLVITDEEPRLSYTRSADFTSYELQVTYSVPITPNAPTNLSTVTGVPIELDWDSPLITTNYKVHTFTSDGTFQVTSGSGNVDYLVVAGGGAGYSGGGGGGGLLQGTVSKSSGSYTVTVGSGGTSSGMDGSDSVFDTITATGGGGGGCGGCGANSFGNDGGSGGGGGAYGAATSLGGSGNTPSTTPIQGNDGGNGVNSGNIPAGGGGGAGGSGGSATSTTGGAGGLGISSSISGNSVVYSAGGGGGVWTAGTAGISADGTGDGNNSGSGFSGTANTGQGGGGGLNTASGGNGGSGIVIVRYVDDGSITATGGTVTTFSQSNNGDGNSPITGYKVFRTDNQYTYSELPDNSANSAGIDFTNNEFLVKGFENGSLEDKSTNSVSITNVIRDEGVTWDSSNTSGFTISGNTITKTTGTGWNNYAISTNTFNPSTGGGEFEFTTDLAHTMMGFSNGVPTTTNSYTVIDYAMYPLSSAHTNGGYKVNVYENGSLVCNNCTNWNTGDTFKQTMDSNGLVKYYKNDVVFYTSTQTASGDYYIHTTIHEPTNAQASATIPIPPSTTSTTGVIGQGVQNLDVSFTDSNLPDNTDDFSIGSWVKLDTQTATLTASDPDEDGYVRDEIRDNDCADAWTSNGSGDTNLRARAYSATYDCEVGYIEWNTSSIPDNAIITNVELLLDVQQSSLAGIGCEINPVTNQPTAGITNALLADLKDGTPYITDDSQCDTVSDGATFDLGSSADTDLQNLLSSDWFAVGLWLDDDTIDSGTHYWFAKSEESATNDPTLTVTYEAPPPNIKLLNLNDVTFNVGTTSASVVESGIVTEDVVWDSTTASGGTISGNTFSITANTWYDGIARSTQTINPATGGGEMICTKTVSPATMCGFKSAGTFNAGSNIFADAEYMMYHNKVYESITGKGSYSTTSSSELKVVMDSNGLVTYYVDGTLVYTSTITASGD
jgi:hypothetical protein